MFRRFVDPLNICPVSSDFVCLTYVAQVVGTWSTILTLIVAAVAGIVAWRQLSRSGEASAKEIYKDYLNLAFQYPRFAYPNRPHVRYADMDDKTKEQYEWFVSILLMACEEILISAGLKGWAITIKTQLKWHVEYLRSTNFQKMKSGYDKYLCKLIDEVTK